ncbi:hypothetical protein B0O99DRAFT_472899, partial [Bisporella sp. PMI_857]
QLPLELRREVYDFLFMSTRVTFGNRSTGRIKHKKIKPASHSLALLRVCRQIFEETKSLWLGLLLFNFERIEYLLDKLSSIPSPTLSQIRHLRTRGHPLILPFEDDDVYYRLAWALKLLPGLRLDTLTVLGSSSGMINYDNLGGLIQHGNGWKELHYITKDSSMLGFKKEELFDADPYWRRPQPSTWKEILLSGDGADSKVAVAVYQAAEDKAIGAPFNEKNSRPLDQTVVPPETLETFGVQEDAHLMSDGQREKELLVVVKRDHSADIAERDRGPYHQHDIREWTDGMAWPAIKRKHVEFDSEYEDSD